MVGALVSEVGLGGIDGGLIETAAGYTGQLVGAAVGEKCTKRCTSPRAEGRPISPRMSPSAPVMSRSPSIPSPTPVVATGSPRLMSRIFGSHEASVAAPIVPESSCKFFPINTADASYASIARAHQQMPSATVVPTTRSPSAYAIPVPCGTTSASATSPARALFNRIVETSLRNPSLSFVPTRGGLESPLRQFASEEAGNFEFLGEDAIKH